MLAAPRALGQRTRIVLIVKLDIIKTLRGIVERLALADITLIQVRWLV